MLDSWLVCLAGTGVSDKLRHLTEGQQEPEYQNQNNKKVICWLVKKEDQRGI